MAAGKDRGRAGTSGAGRTSSTARKPAARKPAAKQPASKQSGARKPAAKKPANGRKPAPKRPAAASGRSGARRTVTANGLVAPGTTPRPRPKSGTQRPARGSKQPPKQSTKRPARQPAKRPPQVRRRRGGGAVLVVLLVVGLLVGLGTAGGYGIGRMVETVRGWWPDPRPELLAEKAAPPEPIELGGPAGTCEPNAVTLDLAAESTTIEGNAVLPFTLRVTNDGRVPCLLDGRGSSMQVTVTDADGEQVWSSADCGASGGSDLLLGPGDVWESSARWSGSSSAPGCEGEREAVPAGRYSAQIVLADVPDAAGDPVRLTVAGEPEAEEEVEAEEEAEAEESDAAADDEESADEEPEPDVDDEADD